MKEPVRWCNGQPNRSYRLSVYPKWTPKGFMHPERTQCVQSIAKLNLVKPIFMARLEAYRKLHKYCEEKSERLYKKYQSIVNKIDLTEAKIENLEKKRDKLFEFKVVQDTRKLNEAEREEWLKDPRFGLGKRILYSEINGKLNILNNEWGVLQSQKHIFDELPGTLNADDLEDTQMMEKEWKKVWDSLEFHPETLILVAQEDTPYVDLDSVDWEKAVGEQFTSYDLYDRSK